LRDSAELPRQRGAESVGIAPNEHATAVMAASINRSIGFYTACLRSEVGRAALECATPLSDNACKARCSRRWFGARSCKPRHDFVEMRESRVPKAKRRDPC
jgi:hypothetical protein